MPQRGETARQPAAGTGNMKGAAKHAPRPRALLAGQKRADYQRNRRQQPNSP